ncbi:hypothetical protein OC834_002754 [Tilletia horrida]|nr:hypothetical protein OC834_002754 [Tilletia horrida]
MQLSYFAFFGSTLLAAGMVAAQAADGLIVSTLPAITTCVPNRLTWQAGQAPFNVFIITPGQPQNILQSLGSTSDNFLIYNPDGRTSGISVGSQVSVYVTDAGGFNSGSAAINVISGGTCSSSAAASTTGASTSSAAASTSSSSAAPVTTSSTSAPVTSASSTTTRTSSTTSASTSTSAAATPSNTGAAAPGLNGLTAVVAGAVGVIAAALI